MSYTHKEPSSFYLGIGPQVGTIMYFPFASPEIIIGKQFVTQNNKTHFFQIQSNWPIFTLFEYESHRKIPLPLVFLSYGIGF